MGDILTVDVFIEIPKGSRNKYEYDRKLGVIRFDRMLYSPVHYPCDYGFITRTLSEDGDPLDALVLVWESTFPGCVIESIPLGIFLMRDEKGDDEKILCVPRQDPHWNHLESLNDVPEHLLDEIEHFFSIYKDLEQKEVTIAGWRDKNEAIAAILAAQRRYEEMLGREGAK
ncbi:MAG TPA: inorganic diphosphatase [Candidatus Atribacteria bacterium]|nr:inorganic diphosphatase [Candidatus Atribacteria bacterium]HPT78223.1 inorganic diphosphatase [Candidatus Atribacteria bacterium]